MPAATRCGRTKRVALFVITASGIPIARKAREPFDHAGKKARLVAEARRVVGLIAIERVLHLGCRRPLRDDAGGERQRAADEVRHPLADQRADDVAARAADSRARRAAH